MGAALTLTYVSDTGRTVVFGGPPYLLTGVSGLHGAEVDVHTFTQYLQDGATYMASQLQPRRIELKGELWTQGSGLDVVQARIRLLETLNPKALGALVLRRGDFVRQIRVAVEVAPAFPQTNGVYFTIVLLAPSPLWEAPGEEAVMIAGVRPEYLWPVSIPAGGVLFGNRDTQGAVTVHNPGDVEAGFRLVLRALRPVSTPTVTHVTGGRYIRVAQALAAGEGLEICTARGEVHVWRLGADGAAESVFDRVDPGSHLTMRLWRGDNVFTVDAASGKDELDAWVYFRPQYVGV